MTQIKHILENKFDDDSDRNFISPRRLHKRPDYLTSLRREKKEFNIQANTTNDFNSDKNVPAMKENFKRIEYKKIFEMDDEEPKINNEVEKSIVFSDREGNFRISRANDPSTTINMVESREFSKRRRGTKTNIMGEAFKSEVGSDSSESAEYDSDPSEEADFSQEGGGARDMPFLKSIVQKIWKKPKKENYKKESSGLSTLFTSQNGSMRMSHSTRKSRRGPLRDTLRVSATQSFKKNLSASRNTIYLDENNNMVNPTTKSIIKKRSVSKKKSNIQKIVFEPSSSEGIWDNLDSVNDDDSSIFQNSAKRPKVLRNMKYPNIIPENGSFDMRITRNKVKGRFKSVSPIRG